MARKILTNSINHLRKPDENIFMMPGIVRDATIPKPIYIKSSNLLPNTRYKVMLDNHPGNEFEDITDFCEPCGESIKQNTHKVGRGRWQYFKSDADGKLEFRARPFGTDEATYTGSSSTGADFTNLWKYAAGRQPTADKGRDKIKLIAYSAVQNPTSNAKVKTLKIDVASVTKDTEGSIDAFGNKGSSTKPQKRIEDAAGRGIICDCVLVPPGRPRRPAPVKAQLYQTFYISSGAVGGDDTCDLQDITLYFRAKASLKSNKSGRYAPGFTVSILECEKDGTPLIASRLAGSTRRTNWHSIRASSTAQIGTRVSFVRPIRVKTNRYYCIAYTPEDPGYELWQNKKGDMSLINGVKTKKKSPGSSKGHKGQMYRYHGFNARLKPGQSGWKALPDLDIKFDVHVAQYRVDDVSIKLVNDDYEFFNLSSTGATWAPGEIVYKDTTARAGTVSITKGKSVITGDSSTDFSDLTFGQKVVVIDSTDSTIRQVFTVDRTIALGNNTSRLFVEEAAKQTMSGSYKLTVIGEVDWYDYYFKSLRLDKSSVNRTEYVANNNQLFEVGDTIIGVETGTSATIDSFNPTPISVFRSDWNATLPAQFNPVTTYNLSYADGGNYKLGTTDRIFYLNAPNHVKDYEGVIISRSQEIVQTDTGIVGNEYKSAEIDLTYKYKGANTKSFSSPSLKVNELGIIMHQWYINDDGSNEHFNEGNADTRHISKILELGPDQKAEDLRVILNAHRPRGTGVDVYAKVQNPADSDSFEDKQWTKLVPISGGDQFASSEARFDYREMEFTWPDYPEANTTLTGSFTLSSGSATVAGANIDTGELDGLEAGRTIRIYNEYFPDTNYFVTSIESANSSTGEITISTTTANNSLLGAGLKIDTLRADQSAHRNGENYNICRYFNASGVPFDTYNKVAVKIVLLAESRKIVPKVDDYRVIAVSA